MKQKKPIQSKNHILDTLFDFFSQIILQAVPIVFQTLQTLLKSIRTGEVFKWSTIAPCFVFAVLVYFKLDHALFSLHPASHWLIEKIYGSSTLYFYYMFFGCFLLGPFIWSFYKTISQKKRMLEVKRALKGARLEGIHYPKTQLIFDQKMDNYCYKMRLSKGIYSIKDFQENTERIQSILGIYIDHIEDRMKEKSIDIYYSKNSLEEKVIRPSNEVKINNKGYFLVGKTRSKWLRENFLSTPHILIGGQTNSGKSNFLRGFITELYESCPNMQFLLIDIKEGVEFKGFEGLKRCRICKSAQKAGSSLLSLQEQMKKRLTLIRDQNCVNIDEYNKKVKKSQFMGRIVVFIDEAGALFSTSVLNSVEMTKTTSSCVERITALGRAAGIHLVLATQRPDKKSVSTSIKTNLQGRLSFRMTDNVSSMVILDNTRATNLSHHKGRAIWQNGIDQVEVQIPWNDPKEYKEKINELKKVEESSHQDKTLSEFLEKKNGLNPHFDIQGVDQFLTQESNH